MLLLFRYKRLKTKTCSIVILFLTFTEVNLQAGESILGIGGTWERTYSRDNSESPDVYSLRGLHPSFNYYYLGDIIDVHVFYHSPLMLASLYQDSSSTTLGAENFTTSQMIGTSVGSGIEILKGLIEPMRLRLSGGLGLGMHLYGDPLGPQDFIFYTKSNSAHSYAPYSLLNFGAGLDISAILFLPSIQRYEPYLAYNLMGMATLFHSPRIDSTSVQLKDIFYTGNTFQVGVIVF